jgi:hypothetical protein
MAGRRRRPAQVDVRKIGHLVGSYDAIDNRRAVDLGRLSDRRLDVAGLFRLESLAAAGARAPREAGRAALSWQALAPLFPRRWRFGNPEVYEYLEGEGNKYAVSASG